MTRLTESAIEEFAIQLFEKQGFAWLYAGSAELLLRMGEDARRKPRAPISLLSYIQSKISIVA